MNLFYVYIDNKYRSFSTLDLALSFAKTNQNSQIFVDEIFDDLDRGSIRTLLYENEKFMLENVSNFY